MLPSNLFCIRTVVKSPMHGPSPTSSQIVDASFAARSRTLVWVLCVLGLAASMAEDIKSYRKLTARADACDPHCTEVRPLHPRAFIGRVPFILTVEVAFGVVASTTKASDTRTTPPSIRRRNATTRRCLRLCSAPSVAPRTALNSPHLAPRPAPASASGASPALLPCILNRCNRKQEACKQSQPEDWKAAVLPCAGPVCSSAVWPRLCD